MLGPTRWNSPLEDWSHLLGREANRFFVKRDDLLPFPAAGNKFRKVVFELERRTPSVQQIWTVGAIASNHCRTTALLAARLGLKCHLVLHGDPKLPGSNVALALLSSLGSTWEVVRPDEVGSRVRALQEELSELDHWIEGGCHTPAGVEAYADAMREVVEQGLPEPRRVWVACGTGATQAGILLGCRRVGWTRTEVIGVSVARAQDRAASAVREALNWFDPQLAEAHIRVTDRYRAGGYGAIDEATLSAVGRAWNYGLPADTTYVGKVLAAVFDESASDDGADLLWHTGGLMNHLVNLTNSYALRDELGGG